MDMTLKENMEYLKDVKVKLKDLTCYTCAEWRSCAYCFDGNNKNGLCIVKSNLDEFYRCG